MSKERRHTFKIYTTWEIDERPGPEKCSMCSREYVDLTCNDIACLSIERDDGKNVVFRLTRTKAQFAEAAALVLDGKLIGRVV